ncbi:MAG: type II toxin-antitoxin system VapC family toxin [Acidimicrobiales bacterium]
MIYLDSSALLKLIVDEPESAPLAEWLAERPESAVASSELARVEVLRACRRVAPSALPTARELLSGLDLVPLSGSVIDMAAELEGETLRSLDALHLASALAVRTALEVFVAYDTRLQSGAAAAGLPTTAPGVPE